MRSPSLDNYRYNKSLSLNAKALRKNMTKAEACLWKYVLKAGGMKGFTFRRQRPVLNYIADFMCTELFLIIEVDGITHSYETVSKQDAKRQADPEKAGFTLIRFNDQEVLNSISSVYEVIEDLVSKIMTEKGISPHVRKGRHRYAFVHPLHPRQRGTLNNHVSITFHL